MENPVKRCGVELGERKVESIMKRKDFSFQMRENQKERLIRLRYYITKQF